ncbi:hypothetical protein HU200_027102 [Digitaria exilis]|uniref:Disease resistance protein At4g27190-like leucine-rich repeats domain-containing protein n=1 Tax=Digitaria exilis TaxID=1010633 RepID=A0A835BX73_9POAL|nr:hypothetical protein HU200_027102 [Digitaria exilis]
MPNLIELLLVKCSNLEELPSSAAALSTLAKLELTGSQIKSFSVEMFEEMNNLQSLKLIDNSKLSFAPGLVSKASSLIDVYIEGHESITEVEINLKRHPTLRSFSLVGTPHIKRLSLHGCRKLESVDIKGAHALEELDLSATAIKELPESIPNLPRLRLLLLMGVPSLRRFPWHKLKRLPDVFCLDQCSDGTDNHSNQQVVQVCICDSRLFYSFNHTTRDLVLRGELLKSFYVQVTSCKANSRKIQEGEHKVINNKQLHVSLPTYADVNHCYQTDGVFMVPMDDVPPIREKERHIVISAVDRYPHGLGYLLSVTKSIFMSDDSHVSCFSDMRSELYDYELEEFVLQKCHKMVDVFRYKHVPTMKNASVSDLKNLTHFFGVGFYPEFTALKHLRLEHCPRLEGIMPCQCALPSLETLDIIFCYNLKAIFYENGTYYYRNYYNLESLRRIHLQELPLLENLHVDDLILIAPAWEELHVRGCWSLRHLPRLDEQPGAKAVKVRGERAWWTKLRWASSSHHGSYEPRFPLASASFRERVIIRTYLR